MKNVRFMTLTALLTAIAIFIPIAMPLKLVIPPASYTLGSHVAKLKIHDALRFSSVFGFLTSYLRSFTQSAKY